MTKQPSLEDIAENYCEHRLKKKNTLEIHRHGFVSILFRML